MSATELTGLIDVHTHLFTHEYRARMRGAGVFDVGGYPMPNWSLQGALDAMDKHDIAASLLSISAPGIDFVSGAALKAIARGTAAKLFPKLAARI